ncbi:pimeloyl-ACP methyl ester carboxylesterase [Actinocorallia herbida]|uniref:Pimeloyl-ACP methyl ester carboxylesterase n=1 Tax=Actinocorallia herbida TaxID=58109 RepID=A0A3N1CZJ6_9ACTN|nr:alpha/beta fold hydrolase [Actinocorallia herbida]ROO86710.1 pimeloyl-ACP methyl ester carboxylesterase [Actinocorallia herbida]
MTSGRIVSFARDGLVFDVVDEGPADGEVVVLLHGFPQTSGSWRILAPHLHAAGYRTLAPDQRGYSPRARPRGRFAYRISALVEDVVALIEAAGGGRVHVVGHDWGAAVAWSLAAARPDLVATVTALSVPHPIAFVRALFTSRQFFLSWYMFFFQLPWLPERVLRGLAASEAVRSRLAKGMNLRDVDHLRDPANTTPAVNWYRGMPFNGPSRLTRSTITVPTLYIHSDRDPALGAKAAALTRRHVAAPYAFHTLEGVNHWIPEEAAPQVAALLLPHLAR